MPRLLAFVIAGAIALTAGGAGAGETVRLTNIGHGYYAGPLYVAQQEKLFEKHGLQADVSVVQGGPLALQTVLTKQADVGILSYEHVLTAAAQGKRVVAIFNVVNRPLNNLIIRKDLTAPEGDLTTRIQRLKGLRVALPSAGGSGEKMLGVLAQKGALKLPGDISTVYLGSEPGSYLAAFQRGVVDAALPVEPAGVMVQQAGAGRIYIDLMKGEVPEFRDLIFMTLSVHPDVLAEKREMLRKVVAVFEEATSLMRRDPKRAKAIMAKEFPTLSPATNEETFEVMSTIWSADGRMSMAQAKAVQTYLQPSGSVPLVLEQTFTGELLRK